MKLTAYDVTALDENYLEIIKHPRLYGDCEQESMEWLPYLTQSSRRPAASKYTGIYPMLSKDLQEFLDSCNYQAKKETLRILAKLSERDSFSKAAEAVKSAVLHRARDADSIVAMFNRLNTGITDLAPIILPTSIPEIPPSKPNLSSYDHILFEGGSEGCES